MARLDSPHQIAKSLTRLTGSLSARPAQSEFEVAYRYRIGVKAIDLLMRNYRRDRRIKKNPADKNDMVERQADIFMLMFDDYTNSVLDKRYQKIDGSVLVGDAEAVQGQPQREMETVTYIRYLKALDTREDVQQEELEVLASLHTLLHYAMRQTFWSSHKQARDIYNIVPKQQQGQVLELVVDITRAVQMFRSVEEGIAYADNRELAMTVVAGLADRESRAHLYGVDATGNAPGIIQNTRTILEARDRLQFATQDFDDMKQQGQPPPSSGNAKFGGLQRKRPARDDMPRKSMRTRREATKQDKCYYCGKMGHFKTDCHSFASDGAKRTWNETLRSQPSQQRGRREWCLPRSNVVRANSRRCDNHPYATSHNTKECWATVGYPQQLKRRESKRKISATLSKRTQPEMGNHNTDNGESKLVGEVVAQYY